MENDNRYDELLIKYLVDEVNPEEKVFVQDWLNAKKENQQYFDSLKKAWELTAVKQTLDYVIDEINVEEKWKHFKQNVADKKQARVISINEQKSFEDEQSQKSGIYRFLVRTAIAASVILVIGLGWKFFFQDRQPTPIAQNTERKRDSLMFVVRHEVNTTGKEKRIQLQDGSLIVLANNSEVTYRKPFTDRRDITLIGKAFFKVTKDNIKPFTVTSGEISTTALGTEFTITTLENASQIIVRLYEGKVVVKAVHKSNKKLKKDVYLLPGQAFVYGSQTIAKVMEFKVSNAAAPEQIIKQELPLDNPSLPENVDGSYFMFNNQPLDKVFDDLAALYNVSIMYDKKDVQNLYLISKYNRTDSLETILKRIAIVYNLTVTSKDNAFIISK